MVYRVKTMCVMSSLLYDRGTKRTSIYRRIGIKGKGVKEHQLLSKTINERRQTVQDETKDRWSLGLKADWWRGLVSRQQQGWKRSRCSAAETREELFQSTSPAEEVVKAGFTAKWKEAFFSLFQQTVSVHLQRCVKQPLIVLLGIC